MLRKQAEAEQAAKLAALQTSVGAAKNSLQNDFARSQQQINDSRVLNNNMLGRSLNPFSGQSDYIKAQTQREYANVDAAAQKELTNRLSNYDAQLADAQNASQGTIQSRIDELMARDKQYTLDLANQTGYLNGQRTIAGQTLDNQKQYQGGLLNLQQQQEDRLRKQSNIDIANYYSDKYGIVVDPKEDFTLVLDQIRGLPTAAEKTAEQKAKAEQEERAWKVVEIMGEVPTGFDAILGIPAGTQTMKAKELAADIAYKNRMATVSERKTSTSERNADLRADAANTPKETKINLNSLASSLRQQFTRKDDNGNIVVSNPEALERAILSQPMSDDEYAYLYNYFGLQIPN